MLPTTGADGANHAGITVMPFASLWNLVPPAAFALGALTRCASPAPAPADSPPPPSAMSDQPPATGAPAAPSFERLLTSATSAYTEPAEVVARDAKAWQSLWGAMSPNRAAGPVAPPVVDFTREMVVLVATGTRPTGGHAVRVDAIEAVQGGGAVVRYTVTSPGAGCMSTQMLTSPVEVVRTARVDGPVRFEGRREAVPC